MDELIFEQFLLPCDSLAWVGMEQAWMGRVMCLDSECLQTVHGVFGFLGRLHWSPRVGCMGLDGKQSP